MSLDAEDIRNEKVKVLRSMKTVALDDVVIGQYRSRAAGGKTLPGYLDDKTVPKGRCGRPCFTVTRDCGWLVCEMSCSAETMTRRASVIQR